MKQPLLEVDGLSKWFPFGRGFLSRRRGAVQAVSDVSFTVPAGTTFGIVGESGCGKSTLGRAILRLIEPSAGRILLNGKDVTKASRREWLSLRRNMQMIFQDSYASMNPRMRVGSIIQEPLNIHRIGSDGERKERVEFLLKTVGLQPDSLGKYPHEFSGGQRQRIDIARALALNPNLIVCDEPVSALDVSIQSQVINLLNDLQERFSLTYIFISHDLSVIRYISNRVAVMYLGKIVELAGKNDLFSNPLHPYSRALLSAVPHPDPDKVRKRTILEGDVPSPVNPPSGCYFRTRCPQVMPVCREISPELAETAPGHQTACHLIGSRKNC
ncbi:MAG: dipeptide ABC transporter ATP-binding protein [Deltaproteobacteria bacterium]|nr:dipeptide ABC transporter ATP-binding protein [Deltaproteobacteria bacterium]